MEFFVDITQMFVCDVGVDLCGSYIGVAEEGLDTTQIGAV